MIELVAADVVFATARETLGLNAAGAKAPDDTYLAAVLRRLAGFLCPCSPTTLVRSVLESHRGMVVDVSEFAERVAEVVEALTAIGDLLELGDVSLGDAEVKGTWLFAAPPSFVARDSGSVFVLGLSADEATPLPTEMRARIVGRGATRFILPQTGEDLAATLRELGIRELSSAAWRKSPKSETAVQLVSGFDGRLLTQGRSGDVPDLVVLDGSRKTRSYRARWVSPQNQTGNFVVRRPQAYGADLWGYAELENGQIRKLVDLPIPGGRWRGCDVAWRIQMALDAIAERPQEYRLTEVDGNVRIDLYSPIPDWARRRLSTVGEQVVADGCLLSFVVGANETGAEEGFLKDLLFLKQAVDKGSE